MTDLPDRTLDAVTKGRAGIEVDPTPGVEFMATGPEAVDLVRLVVIRSSLRFEVNTGIKMSRMSALKAANAALGTKYRRKQAALDHLDGLLTAFDDDE